MRVGLLECLPDELAQHDQRIDDGLGIHKQTPCVPGSSAPRWPRPDVGRFHDEGAGSPAAYAGAYGHQDIEEGERGMSRVLIALVATMAVAGCGSQAPTSPGVSLAAEVPTSSAPGAPVLSAPLVPLAITRVEEGEQAGEGIVTITGTAPVGATVTCYDPDLQDKTSVTATRSGPSFEVVGWWWQFSAVVSCSDGAATVTVDTLPTPAPTQKPFTVRGGRADGIKGPFTLKGGNYTLEWTARGGDTGSCFGMGWLNTPDGSDTDPIEAIFDLSADTTKTRSGTSEIVGIMPGKYVIGTITTCRWTVRFVNYAAP